MKNNSIKLNCLSIIPAILGISLVLTPVAHAQIASDSPSSKTSTDTAKTPSGNHHWRLLGGAVIIIVIGGLFFLKKGDSSSEVTETHEEGKNNKSE